MPIRVMIVDDHEIARLGLRQIFEGTEVEIIAEASGGERAQRQLETIDPDLILLDVRMPDGDGLKFLMKVKLNRPGIPILLLSAYDNPVYFHQAVALSAAGYLLKSTPRERLLEAVRAVASGQTIWRREELRRMTGALATPRMNADVGVPLTQREREVLEHLCEGRTNREIAAKCASPTRQ